MKNDQIKIGGTYLAKITDKVVTVRLDAQNPHGGWDATNLATNKKVRIKSAQRLRGPAPEHQTRQRARTITAAPAADVVTEILVSAQALPAEVTAPTKKSADETKAKKSSGLDAAFAVLKAKGEPMTCKAIVDEMLAKGLWKTSGKTPSATIYSAMLREIDTKPGERRFNKTGRGLFTINAT